MTFSRFLAALVFLAPLLTPFVYGVYVMWTEVPDDSRPPYQVWAADYAGVCIIVLVVGAAAGVLVGWITLVHWLWVEVPR